MYYKFWQISIPWNKESFKKLINLLLFHSLPISGHSKMKSYNQDSQFWRKTLLPLKLVVKFGQHLCMMILSNLLCCFLHDHKYLGIKSQIIVLLNLFCHFLHEHKYFGIKSRIMVFINLFHYFFPLSRIVWDEILQFFQIFPLPFTS